MAKKGKKLNKGGRVLVKFNTGTIPHKSDKDYTRKKKHKKRIEGDDIND